MSELRLHNVRVWFRDGTEQAFTFRGRYHFQISDAIGRRCRAAGMDLWCIEVSGA